MTHSPYEQATSEMLAEIIRQAESRLEAQLTAGIGADQRAMTFAGLLLAAAAVLFGAAITLSPQALPFWLIMLVGSGLTLSALLAIWSAQPVEWDYIGNTPESWKEDIELQTSLHAALASSAEWYAEMIAANEMVIGAAGRLMQKAVNIAVGAIALGGIAAIGVAMTR